jgi:hypothetical protein
VLIPVNEVVLVKNRLSMRYTARAVTVFISLATGCSGPIVISESGLSLEEALKADYTFPVYAIRETADSEFSELTPVYSYSITESDGDYYSTQFFQPVDGSSEVVVRLSVCTQCTPYFSSLNPYSEDYERFQEIMVMTEMEIPWEDGISGHAFVCDIGGAFPKRDAGSCLVWGDNHGYAHIIRTFWPFDTLERFVNSSENNR